MAGNSEAEPMIVLQALATPLGFLAFTLGLFVAILIWECGQPAYAHLRRARERWPDNFLLYVLNMLIGREMGQMLAVMLISWGDPYGMALLPLTDWHPLVILAISILALDFWQYAFHRLMHRFHFLWRSHRVHHSDEGFDLTTGFRFHPFEGILNIFWRVVLVQALGIDWLALVVYALTATAVDFFTHANVLLNPALDRVLRGCIVTPDMHRIHHSMDPADSNTNFGTIFTFWDRLCGTYRAQAARGRHDIRTGIEPLTTNKANGPWQVLRMPFAK